MHGLQNGDDMISQCAWCLKLMGEKAPLTDKSITHGICQECHIKQMKQIKEMKREVGR